MKPIKITTYKELYSYVENTRDKNIGFLVIVSRGGLGKSQIIKKNTYPDATLVFKGHATPLSIYMSIYKHRNHLIVFDDVDELTRNKTTVSLLKQICDTDAVKTLYYSSSATYEGMKIPPKFDTKNNVIILTNDLKKADKNLEAVWSRAIIVKFEPTKQEVINMLKEWATDKEILSFLEEKDIKNLNARHYTRATELKMSGIDWKDNLLQESDLEQELDPKELARDLMLLTDITERNTRWLVETGLSIRTLQRYINEIMEE